MAKKSEAVFADAATAEQFAVALQKHLDSVSPTVAQARFVELIAQLRGWTTGKALKSSEPTTPVKPPFEEEPPW